MKTFKDLEFEKDDQDGIGTGILFDNNFGVSVIRNRYSQGGEQGLYEVAVIYMAPGDSVSVIHYDNPVANGDVIGYLTEDEVTDIMKRVSEL